MSDCVAWTRGRAFPRLALAGLGLLLLSGCSSDVTRFTQSQSPFSNPFASKTRRADARRDGLAAGARGPRSVGDAQRFALEAAGGGRLGCGLDRRRRLAGRRRQRRDSGHAFGPLRRARRRASLRQWSFQRLRGQERDAHSSCPSITPMATPSPAPRRRGRRESATRTSPTPNRPSPRRARRRKKKEKAAKADKSGKEGEKSASKNGKGAAVA